MRGWNKLLDVTDESHGDVLVTMPRYLSEALVDSYDAMLSFAVGKEEIESIRDKDWEQAKQIDLRMRRLLARYDAEPGWTVEGEPMNNGVLKLVQAFTHELKLDTKLGDLDVRSLYVVAGRLTQDREMQVTYVNEMLTWILHGPGRPRLGTEVGKLTIGDFESLAKKLEGNW